MQRRTLIAAAALAPSAGIFPAASHADTVPGISPASLNELLHPYLAQYNLPALAAAVVCRGVTVAAGAVGLRRVDADIPVTINDRFHIGSDTKAMTSLLAGMFVEEGLLHWHSTVGSVFPELVATIDTGLSRVTMLQLLSHTSGLRDGDMFIDLLLESLAQLALNLDELRYWLIERAAKQQLTTVPGKTFAYCNLGYILAGAMIERTGKTTWEELVAVRIFDPFGFKTAGFGPQSSIGRTDAPLGHFRREDGTLKPLLAGPDGDSPALVGPAGTVHVSILELAVWAGWQAGEGRRGPPLVRPATLRKLHTPIIDVLPPPNSPPGTPSAGQYALGWGIVREPYAKEPLLKHDGSNTICIASITLQPSKDFAMVMTANVGGPKADRALRALSAELYEGFATRS